MNTIETLVIGLLGGVGAALVNIFWQSFTHRRENEITSIREQLAKVYGPLHYLNMANQNLFKLIEKYQTTCGGHEGQGVAERVLVTQSEVVDDLIKESNSFGEEVMKNNKQITAILRENWHLIDISDFECFSNFHVDRTRQERFRPGMSAFVMSKELGPILYMRPEMIELIHTKFTAKKRRLNKLVSRSGWHGLASFCRAMQCGRD